MRAGRRRLLAAAPPRPRFERFTERLARLLGVGPDRIRALLQGVDDERRWVPGVVRVCPVDGGRLVRVGPGVRFAYAGRVAERVLVLQGACRPSAGDRALRPGDEQIVGCPCELVASPGPDLIYAAAPLRPEPAQDAVATDPR